MQLTVLGLNHRTAPVEIRERFNFSNDRVASILRRLRNYDNIPEAMLLSTCNRTELYMVIEIRMKQFLLSNHCSSIWQANITKANIFTI